MIGELGYDICVLNLSDAGLTDDRLAHALSTMPPQVLMQLLSWCPIAHSLAHSLNEVFTCTWHYEISCPTRSVARSSRRHRCCLREKVLRYPRGLEHLVSLHPRVRGEFMTMSMVLFRLKSHDDDRVTFLVKGILLIDVRLT